MNSLQTLWLVLAALYVFESFDLAPAGKALLSEGLGGFRVASHRLSLKHPLPASRIFALDGAGSWDSAALQARLDEFDKATRWLKFLCLNFFIFLFIFMPLFYLRLEAFPRVFLGCIGCCVLLWWSCALAAYLAARRLGYASPASLALPSLLAPARAMRGVELLSRDLIKDWQALAAAQLLMKPDDFKGLCQKALLDEEFRPQVPPRLPPAWLPGEGGLAGFKIWLRSRSVSPEALLAVPPPSQAESRSYCPRCLSQFSLEAGNCSDCGLELRRLKSN